MRIHFYIKSTRKWINELALDLDTLNYSKLEQKVTKQNNINLVNSNESSFMPGKNSTFQKT